MKPINILRMRAASFSAVTRTYNTGTAVAETVPAGATSVTIRVVGGGGSGAHTIDATSGGGGSAAYALKTIAVVGGNTMTYTVGIGGAGQPTDDTSGNDGVDSTVSGTVSGGAVAMTGGKGFAGVVLSLGGAGGAATGGTTNTAGNAGAGTGTGGAAVYSTYGAGSNGRQLTGSTSAAGGAGVVIFEYT